MVYNHLKKKVVSLKLDEDVVEQLPSEAQTATYLITPISGKDYDNFTGQPINLVGTYIEPVEYQIIDYKTPQRLWQAIRERGAGTSYIATKLPPSLDSNEGQFSTTDILHITHENIFQLRIRPDDSYLGYLQELLNTPFIYVPIHVKGYHQVDQRVGTDCAELAIYGKRRQGYNYNYGGPRGILQYLTPRGYSSISLTKNKDEVYYNTEDGEKVKVIPRTIKTLGITPGDILHFDTQVSVFYKDQGILGILDPEDLLIQAYYGGVKITTLKESGFTSRTFRIYSWKS